MSNITEQTIIIRKSDEQLFFDIVHSDTDISSVNLIYEDTSVCVYVFDCNGDGVFYMGILPYLALEINYGNGDLITEVLLEDKVVETDETLTTQLHRFIPNECIEKVKGLIKYTM